MKQSQEPEKETEQQKIENIYKIVRKTQLYPFFSQEWLQQTFDFDKLVLYSNQEINLLNLEEKKENKQQGTAQKMTLWEQSNYEKTMRIITEEAKVNLMLRILKDYTLFYNNQQEFRNSLTVAASLFNMPPDMLQIKMEDYLDHLGIIFQRLFNHEEALQLSGNQLLIEHIANTLQNALKQEFIPCIEKKQEFYVAIYFMQIMQKIYSLDEANIFYWSEEYQVFKLLIDFVTRFYQLYSKIVSLQFLETLGSMIVTELFKTRKQVFLDQLSDAKGQIGLIKDVIIPELSTLFPEKKQKLRPIKEMGDKLERDLKFKETPQTGSTALDILNSL